MAAEASLYGDVVPVGGAPFRAQLQSITASGMATWKPEHGEPRKLTLADLCCWGSFAEPPTQSQVVLVDGSLIMADVVSVNKQQLTFDWGLVGELKLPLEWVSGVLLSPPVDRQAADRLRFRLLPTDSHAETDRLILLNGDELAGELVAMSDAAVKIRTPAGETTVAKEKIAAIAFDPSLAAKPDPKQPRIWIGFDDGSRLVAAAIVVQGDQAKVTFAAQPPVTVSAAKLVALQPLDGRETYLSDLKPADYQHIPFLDLKWSYRNDRNVLGTQLRAGGRLYLKGLGLHSAARLTYDLDKPYRTFATDAAIDDQTNGQGSAIFRVYTDDGSGKWQLKYESPTVRGGAAPLPISVDFSGAKRLSLHVDFADHGDIQAHADWLNARLLP